MTSLDVALRRARAPFSKQLAEQLIVLSNFGTNGRPLKFGAMVDWIPTSSDWLNVLANWTMVAIWLVYLQVFLRSFRRQTVPKIVITRAAGRSLDGSCFVSNMSSDAVYIESVIVEVSTQDQSLACSVTDFEHFDGEDAAPDPKLRTFHGPLPPSQYTVLGTFESLIDTAARRTGMDSGQFKRTAEYVSVTVTILADYASARLLVGAERSFTARADQGWKLTADTRSSVLITSSGERRRLYDTLEHLD